MRITPIVAVIFLFIVVLTLGSRASAQTASQTLDQQIKAAEEENQKLKKLRQLQEENKRLKAELDGSSGMQPVPTPTPAVTSTPIAKPSPSPAPSSPSPTPPQLSRIDYKKLQSDTCGRDSVDEICNLVHSVLQRGYIDPSDDDTTRIEYLMTERVFVKDVTLDTQAARTDKQIGSDVKSAGTTSLVAKGGIPLIMSVATETGAVVSSVNGTTVSFRFNPIGVMEYFTDSQTRNLDSAPPPEKVTAFLRRTALGLSYDMSRGVPTPMFTGRHDQFSGASFRYEFINQRDPTAQKAQRLTNDFVRDAGIGFTNAATDSLKTVFGLGERNSSPPQEIKDFLDMLQKAVEDNTTEINRKPEAERSKLLYKVIADAFAKLPINDIKKDTPVLNALRSYADALVKYRTAEERLQRRLKTGSLFTFDYNFDRTFTASDTSGFRLIYEKGTDKGWDFTFNGSATLFHHPNFHVPVVPINALAEPQKRFRDFSFAMQLDVPFGGHMESLANSTFSLAAKYQRMNTDSVTLFDGTVISGIKGDIFLGQAKLLIPIRKTGLFFPISFTYANRTELIREKKSRGNFGFTFDFSSLLEKWVTGALGPK